MIRFNGAYSIYSCAGGARAVHYCSDVDRKLEVDGTVTPAPVKLISHEFRNLDHTIALKHFEFCLSSSNPEKESSNHKNYTCK